MTLDSTVRRAPRTVLAALAITLPGAIGCASVPSTDNGAEAAAGATSSGGLVPTPQDGGAAGSTTPSAVFPNYAFNYPRAVSSPVMTDEVVVTNGALSAALLANGPDTYYPSQLHRIQSPPFTTTATSQGELILWGFDEGYHAIQNAKFTVNYDVSRVRTHVDDIEWEGKTNSNWSADIEYSALPKKRVLVANVSYTNVSARPLPLKIAALLVNPQITQRRTWSWWDPQPGAVNVNFNASTGYGAIESQSTDGNAFLVFGFSGPSSSHAVTTNDEYAGWNRTGQFSGANSLNGATRHFEDMAYDFGTVNPGVTVSAAAVLAMDSDASTARALYSDTVRNLNPALAAATNDWNGAWARTGFKVVTPEPNFDQMSQLAMSNALTSWDWSNGNVWTTMQGGDNGRGTEYLWDTAYASWAELLSNPSAAKSTIRNLFGLDWKRYYALSVPDKASVGTWYSYNQIAYATLVYQYVALTGDTAFLTEVQPNGQQVVEILNDQLNYVNRTIKYDFGAGSNLLEVVPHYVGVVPDLVAATYWMAQKLESMAALVGRGDIVSSARDAKSTAYQKTQSLWSPAQAWFSTGAGTNTYTSQVFNMIFSGALTPAQISGILARKADFIFPFGTRSLASYDVDYNSTTPRGDWDGPGNYVANPADMLKSLSYAGDANALYDLASGISRWYTWRPWQPQGIEATTGKAIGPIATSTNTAESSYLGVVPFDMVGLRPALGGVDIYDAFPANWSNGVGRATFQGATYATQVSLTIAGAALTFYVDKPLPGAANYRYASLYDGQGNYLGDWFSQRLPKGMAAGSAVLHFGPRPRTTLTAVDELTVVTNAANEANFAIANPFGSMAFSVGSTGSQIVTVNVAGIGGAVYTATVNGRAIGQYRADGGGAFAVSFTTASQSDAVVITRS